MQQISIAQQKRGEIYAALVAWPPGLSRIVVEYTISARELIEEYGMQHYLHEHTWKYIWRGTDFQIDIVWRGPTQPYSLNFHCKALATRHTMTAWVNDFDGCDLIGAIEQKILELPDRAGIMYVIQCMVDSMMARNAIV